jgi:hypothetical protein
MLSMILFALLTALASILTPTQKPALDAGTCVPTHILTSHEVGYPATMEWTEPGEMQRRVTVVFDDEGNPVRYSELATTQRLADFDRIGAYRLVHLDLEADLAIVEKQHSGPTDRTQEQLEVTDELLQSGALGMPAQTIDHVRASCTDS